MKASPANIIISRTDSIGDVVLTLPVAAVLKEYFPGVNIAFIGKSYTRPVIMACRHVDAFIDKEDFLTQPVTVRGNKPDMILHVLPDPAIATRAAGLGIRWRIGTTNRLFHWRTCNKLVKLSRRHSPLHEAQLNLKLLEPLGYKKDRTLAEIGLLFGLTKLQPLPERFTGLLAENKYNLILHPKSQGSAREWGLANFIELIQLLDDRYQIFISGTAAERTQLVPLFEKVGNRVIDITGQQSLEEFISFIAMADGLLANSTGPLHIAGALKKDAFGIYPPMRPIHPGRWAPLGPGAKVFVLNRVCSDCRKLPLQCHCIREVPPGVLKASLDESLLHIKRKIS